ncbi:hypothetical protein LJR290_004911 [Variovorax sp. LjRoot290]|uniref:hypothetical protein n=1 Tax=unclassified Variovorax TaxID=663243 RepID=UPI003ECDD92C
MQFQKNRLATAALLAACAWIATGCDMTPGVIYVANGADFNVMSLTDAQDVCDTPGRVAYLSWWDSATLKGCWVRERGEIVARFPGMAERRIPVGDFQRTELAGYRNLTLD